MKGNLVVLAGVVCAVSAAFGQGLAVGDAAPDIPPRDTVFGISLFVENDGGYLKGIDTTDRWYTSGTALVLQWQGESADRIVSSIPSFGNEFSLERDGTSYAMGVVGSMNIYTPRVIRDENPRFGDRPYAGWSYAGVMFQRANRAASVPVFEHMEIDVSLLGPSSGAEDAQEWVHSTFDQIYPQGWDYQVRDEVGVDFRYQRRWRIDLIHPRRPTGPAMQLIPDAGFSLGTIHTYASAGATLRYGWNLPDDFGIGQIRYADDFTRPLGRADGHGGGGASGYFYLRPGIKLVAHDATLGDSLFRDNLVSVDEEPLVGEVTLGVAVTFLRHWRASYSHTFVSPEFDGQSSWHSYASASLSAVFTW